MNELLEAVKSNQSSLSIKLIDEGKDLNQIDNAIGSEGWTALHWAVYHENVGIVKAILAKAEGKKLVNCKTSKPYLLGFFNLKGEQTPLHLANNVRENKSPNIEIIRALIDAGADRNIVDYHRNYPLPADIPQFPNKVTLRLWTSKGHGSDVGHITLQTYVGGPDGKGIYASFWPGVENDSHDHPDYYYKKNQNNYLRNYAYDKLVEQRDADFTFDLYSLDIGKINSTFESFSHSNFRWSLFPSSLLGLDLTTNCSGLTAILLKAGKFEERLNSLDKTILNGHMDKVGRYGKFAARGIANTRTKDPVLGLFVAGTAIGYSIYNLTRVNLGNYLRPDDLFNLAKLLKNSYQESVAQVLSEFNHKKNSIQEKMTCQL